MTSLAHQPIPQPMQPIQQGALPQASAPLTPLCHVTVVAPRRRADLALPADIPLPHVMPGLLRALGEAGGEAASDPGWVLQRLGGAPLDLGQSLAALGVLDGEILYLRPREAAMPAALFDDVADVVATGVKDGSGRWEQRHTKAMGVGVAAGLLALGAPALMLAGGSAVSLAVVSGMLALVLLIVGTVLSRAVGNSSAGALIGYTALPYAFLGGMFALSSGVVGAPQLLAALACTALVATLGAALTSDGVAGFLGTAIATVVGAIGAAVVMIFDVPAAGVAAIIVTLLIAFSPMIPGMSFKMARVPLPELPTNAEELRADNQRLDSAAVLERTGQARRYSTGMIIGLSLTAAGALVLLVMEDSWMAVAMAAVLCLALLLRSRVYHGLGQRVWLMVTGVAGLVALGVGMSAGMGTVAAAGLALGLLWAALLALGLGLWLPAGRPSPFWGRAGDIVDVILIVALFPLALGVLDVYSWIRGLSG
ncbi:type VII secretion integral membrane protein EccD [Nonomuraea endophytica]|uniref:type VII secretion integral membrane protein EccD n=1 Tax=Nonomuraea endophytica TaxID=714136 RepID=UPI0037C9BF68